jgi:hypothetical protein
MTTQDLRLEFGLRLISAGVPSAAHFATVFQNRPLESA